MALAPRDTRPARPARPLYALVGAGDTAVATLRTVTGSAPHVVEAVRAQVAVLPRQVRELPEQAQAAVSATVSATVGAALESYADLAERGRTVVERVREQRATQDLEASARTAAQRTKAVADTAQAAGTRTRHAAAEATRTARANARRTTRATAAAVEAVAGTAAAAGRAAEEAVEQLGEPDSAQG